ALRDARREPGADVGLACHLDYKITSVECGLMYSPDGRWWWNGAAWIPTPQWRTRYEHTPWTRKLQIAVLGLQALGLLFAAATFPFIYSSMLDTNALFASN